jgi:chromatin remodeling complex protein RSC6
MAIKKKNKKNRNFNRALTAISTLFTLGNILSPHEINNCIFCSASTDYEEEELRIAIENEEHAPTTS